MKRRDFVSLVGVALVCPFASAQSAMPVIGFLNAASPEEYKFYVEGFSRGLLEIGYAEGRNVMIEYRWANGRYDRLPSLAADLVAHHVAVIAANTPAALPAKTATSAIPIVFFTGYDPVESGLVASLNRPGGNVTGITGLSVELTGKQVGLLRELVPTAKSFAFLVNPTNPNAEGYAKDAHVAVRSLGLGINVLNAKTESEIATAFAELGQAKPGGLVIAPDAFFIAHRDLILSQAKRVAIPAIYPFREFAADGLMTYAPSLVDAYRQMGIYVGRILKGEKPADLPVLQPTEFELVINLKIAKGLKIDVPPTLLARADEVIE